MEEMQRDWWAAPVRPELAALVFPYTSEQSLRFEVDVLPLAAYS